jgi:hypothetical protein
MFQAEVVEKIKTHVLCSIFFFENHAVYEIMWKNVVQPGSPRMTIWRMHDACWIPKATNTHSEYVIFIAFPRQKWFHESALMLSWYELLFHYCLALSERKFANAPPSFVIFICLYAHNKSITTERIVVRLHNTGWFYKDSCRRISIFC